MFICQFFSESSHNIWEKILQILPHKRNTTTSYPGQGTICVYSGSNNAGLAIRAGHRYRILKEPHTNKDMIRLMYDCSCSYCLISLLLLICWWRLLGIITWWTRVRRWLFHFLRRPLDRVKLNQFVRLLRQLDLLTLSLFVDVETLIHHSHSPLCHVIFRLT